MQKLKKGPPKNGGGAPNVGVSDRVSLTADSDVHHSQVPGDKSGICGLERARGHLSPFIELALEEVGTILDPQKRLTGLWLAKGQRPHGGR